MSKRRNLAIAGLAALAGWMTWVRQPKRYPPAATLLTYRGDPQERLISLPSLPNLRDFGGYPTRDGRRVKRGLLYRASSLAHLSDDDLTKLEELGLRLICDLRTPEEVAEAPDRLPQSAEYLHLPAHAAHNSRPSLRNVFGMMMKRGYLERILPRLYTEVMIDQNPHVFAEIFRRVAEGQLPLLIHCTAGKDRTGLSAALLLSWLGVEDELIVQDYSISNLFYDDFARISSRLLKQLGQLGIKEAEVYPLMVADPRTMETTLAHIRHYYGSVEAYLRGPGGLDTATLQAVKERLIEEHP
ncbi:MAG: tyrosine-protein phosphatase [Anaerolineae bacterium]|nr:tyrosine-protein phosphatase [Anaerolineae bacterium]MDW8171543.1 tyrosine-protein phosphatase [Anaerolineae bacterium]